MEKILQVAGKSSLMNLAARAIALLILFNSYLYSQNKSESDFGIKFNGFVKTDLMYDTRQTVNFREGHFNLYPSNEMLDKNGIDLNDKSNFNILSIQTRLTGKITAPDAFGAKTSGMIEGEFFGTSDGDINGFRLRHAFVKFDWQSTSLLVGQFWHPMFVTDVFPGVVSFNTGVPFQPFSRNPQVRVTQSLDNVKLIGVIASQRDFRNVGPAGASSVYLRNAVLPNLHLQMQYKTGSHLFGIGADYKMLMPRSVTNKNIQTDETLQGLSGILYAKVNLAPVTIRLEGVYGQNLSDVLMLGGFAVSEIDTITDVQKYSSLNCYSLWTDISVGKEIEFALFAGYTKNLGADKNIIGQSFQFINNIDNIFRLSPRIVFNSYSTKLAGEVEYTAAAYGKQNNSNFGKVENTKSISNIRFLVSAIFTF